MGRKTEPEGSSSRDERGGSSGGKWGIGVSSNYVWWSLDMILRDERAAAEITGLIQNIIMKLVEDMVVEPLVEVV